MSLSRHFIGLALAAACCASLPAAADPRYGVTIVGAADSVGRGINGLGQVVGNVYSGGESYRAFYGDGTTLLDLGTLGGASAFAWGINDAGTVVGWAEDASGTRRPFSYAGGAMSGLGTLGGANGGFAFAINNRGQVVGAAATVTEEAHAFLYTGGSMQDLGTLPAVDVFDSAARAINENGKIAGGSLTGEFTPPEPSYHAFVRCCDGTLTDLGTFGGQYSLAQGINDLGDVVGVAATEEFRVNHAFLYSHGAMTDLGTLDADTYSEAVDINNLGQVVGYSAGSGFLYEGGAMVGLNTLIDPASGWNVIDAAAINDAQQIAGTACIAGVCYAVRLDLVSAVPEPATLPMLAAGLGLFWWAGWRRRSVRR